VGGSLAVSTATNTTGLPVPTTSTVIATGGGTALGSAANGGSTTSIDTGPSSLAAGYTAGVGSQATAVGGDNGSTGATATTVAGGGGVAAAVNSNGDVSLSLNGVQEA